MPPELEPFEAIRLTTQRNTCSTVGPGCDPIPRSRFDRLLGVDYERVARAVARPRDDWSNRDQRELARAIAP